MKYTVDEIERRWLAEATALPALDGLDHVLIEDKYLINTRMRLRKVTGKESVTYKLCKKYGKHRPFTEAITNIYLSEAEYDVFLSLPGTAFDRNRYYHRIGTVNWAISLPLTRGPILVEAEFVSLDAALAVIPPPYCLDEVSDQIAYEGATLANCVARDQPQRQSISDEKPCRFSDPT